MIIKSAGRSSKKRGDSSKRVLTVVVKSVLNVVKRVLVVVVNRVLVVLMKR